MTLLQECLDEKLQSLMDFIVKHKVYSVECKKEACLMRIFWLGKNKTMFLSKEEEVYDDLAYKDNYFLIVKLKGLM